MSVERHLEKVIWQAKYYGHEYVVHFKGPDGLEFLEMYPDERTLVRGKRFWNKFDPKFSTFRVFDVEYWYSYSQGGD